MMTPLRALAGAIFAVLMVAGCAGGESSNDRSFSELLEWIPDARATEEYVLLVNLATLRETTGTARPPDDATLEELVDYQEQLRERSGRADFEPVILDQNLLDERVYANVRDYLHFDFGDVDLVANGGEPPNLMFVAGGNFDADAAVETLEVCDGCFEPTDTYEHRGVTYYGWGEAFEQHLRERLSPPMYDRLGRGGRLYVSDDMLVRTHDDRLMEAAIAAGALDDNRSLADVDDFRIAADKLDDLDTWLAFLSRSTQGPELWDEVGDFLLGFVEPDAAPRFLEQWEPAAGTPVLREYVLVGAGVVAGETPYLVVVLVHEDEATAEENVDLLKRRIAEVDSASTGVPWRETITDAEIDRDGRMLVARLHGLDYWTFLDDADPLLLHE